MQLIKVFLCALTVVASQTVTAENKAPNLYFEQALYEHLHERYLSAITLSEVLSEKTNETDIKQQVLLSTSYYNYQLPSISLDILKQSLNTKLSKNDKDILLFNVAKNHYNDQQFEQALTIFNSIKEPINSQVIDELNYLIIESYLATDNIKQAENHAKKLTTNLIYYPYIVHNLAIAYLNANQFSNALKWTQVLNNEQFFQYYELKDSLLLATGIFHLREKQYEKATQQLLKITKGSPYSAKGLLALGKSLTDSGDTIEGLRFYNYLSNYPKQNIYYQESLIDIAERNKTDGAIPLFKHAISHYDDLILQISDLSHNDLTEELSHCLLNISQSELCQTTDLWLEDFKTNHAYKSKITQHKQLLEIQQTLFKWFEKIPVYRFILKQRQDDFDQKLPLINEKFNPKELATLTSQFNDLYDQLNTIKTTNSPYAFINEDESDHLDDIDYVEVTVKRINKESIQELRERAEFTKGILMWDLAQQKPLRQRQATKNLNDVKVLLDTAEKGMDKLQKLNELGDLRLNQLSDTLENAEQNLQLLEEQVNYLLTKNAQYITNISKQYLEQRKARLIALNSRSKFLLTQLQDKQ